MVANVRYMGYFREDLVLYSRRLCLAQRTINDPTFLCAPADEIDVELMGVAPGGNIFKAWPWEPPRDMTQRRG